MLIQGFSKYTRTEKLQILGLQESDFNQFQLVSPSINALLADISENVVSAYSLPFSLAPNFKINGRDYVLPMVTEESSVVAAAASAARFWYDKGGFSAQVISTTKEGQIHFLWKECQKWLKENFQDIKKQLFIASEPLLENMRKRGGGISRMELIDYSDKVEDYFQIRIGFETVDAMGANLINSCLELMSESLVQFAETQFGNRDRIEIIMSILSNHTPDCLVECSVECTTKDLGGINPQLSGIEFARRFKTAVDIAHVDIYRAVTHNKGIFNGIDAVVLATGNDFRAIEAAGHAYASSVSRYASLSFVDYTNDQFRFSMRLPLALGTVGGLTSVHPLAALSLKILGNPTAKVLMQVAAAAGMANHFSAIRALITTGIQKGHMKLQLQNILHTLHATSHEKEQVVTMFTDQTVSYKAVQDYLEKIRRQ